MRGLTFALLTAAAVIGFTATAPHATAQVDVSIGVAPDCPYGYLRRCPLWLRPGRLLRPGVVSLAASSSALVHGFTAPRTSTGV